MTCMTWSPSVVCKQSYGQLYHSSSLYTLVLRQELLLLAAGLLRRTSGTRETTTQAAPSTMVATNNAIDTDNTTVLHCTVLRSRQYPSFPVGENNIFFVFLL